MPRSFSSVFSVALGVTLLGASLGAGHAADKPKVAYVPSIAVQPEVFLPDGRTSRTYNTPKGLSFWTSDLPVQQGDKIKLNVFVATGGAELKQVKIRLDNVKLLDLTAAPWNTSLDTATLTPGYHMIEIWAQTDGDRPQTSSKAFTFSLVKELPASIAVKGTQQAAINGIPTNETTPPATDVTPALPDFLTGKPVNEKARVDLTAQQATAASALKAGSQTLTIRESTIFYAVAKPGSAAKFYAFVLTRDGSPILSSTQPFDLNYQRLKIQKRSDSEAGLRSGQVVLWVWGIDVQGRPGLPIKTVLDIQ